MVEDLRPKDRFQWIEKSRLIKPVVFEFANSNENARIADSRRSAINLSLAPYSGPWEEGQVSHLLHRTLFGVTKSEINYFKSLSVGNAVDEILKSSPAPALPVNDYNNSSAGITDPNVPFGETWIYAPHSGNIESNKIVSFKGWLIKNVLLQQPTIHEKIIFFWHNLLVTKVWDVFIAKASYQYFETLRINALGNYKTLIKAITLDPSMLIFLNGGSNSKAAPDENYARELQELFCIGKGAGSHYTEGDVQAAARVLTGWGINWDVYSKNGSFVSSFRPQLHETSDKQFSSFYNSKVIQGKTGMQGADELDELLTMILGTDECARYICRRLYSFFVFNTIDEATEEAVIKPLAEIFRATNYEILPVLKTLFKSTHFYDTANKGALIKNPIDHTLGVWRTLSVFNKDKHDLSAQYLIENNLLWHMASQGLEMGDPPNVAGWQAYYQVPLLDKAWITTDTITSRAKTTDSLVSYGFWVTNELILKADLIAFVKNLTNPSDPVALLKESATLLSGLDINEATITNLKAILLSGQQNDSYWTIAWNAHVADPVNEINRLTVLTRLQATFQRMLQLGQCQLM